VTERKDININERTNMIPFNSNKSTNQMQQFLNRPDHDKQHCYHHAPTVKPEAATAVELLMMGVRTPETC
jgi:hypothetical protein